METLKESLEELKKALDKEIRKVTSKSDITPVELENMTKTLCLIEKIKMIEEGEEYWDGEKSGRTRSYGTMRPEGWIAPPMSYGFMPVNQYEPMPERHDTMSGRRMRSSSTGRYMSGDSGQSGHSIKDRMIAKLEEMYDEAKTDHERKIVDEWIDRLAVSETHESR